MRLLYLGEHDVDDVAKWSGIPYYLSRALARAFDDVQVVQVPALAASGGGIDEALRAIGDFASATVQASRADAVFCQGMSVLPYLRTALPKLYWHDATHFGLERMPMAEFRAAHASLHRWDELLLGNTDLLAFASSWAVQQCIDAYGVSRERLMVLPFGVNLDAPPDEAAVRRAIAARSSERCELVFVGRRWKRKGLPLAVALAGRLNEHGLPTRLTVIGCQPEDTQLLAHDFVRQRGFLRKDVPAELAVLEADLRRSHFLVHPARFECFGIALAEANAFGVPVLASDVAGIPSVVHEGRNGHLFPLGGFLEGATRRILALYQDYASFYPALARDAWRETCARLSWDHGAAQLRARAEALVAVRGDASPGDGS
jgi:glycosyltransferase involved in cell wall biosynthesis